MSCGSVNDPVPSTASAAVSASENAMLYSPATSCWMFCTDAPVSAAVALIGVLAEIRLASPPPSA